MENLDKQMEETAKEYDICSVRKINTILADVKQLLQKVKLKSTACDSHDSEHMKDSDIMTESYIESTERDKKENSPNNDFKGPETEIKHDHNHDHKNEDIDMAFDK